jgi:hypothetical protein
LSPRTITSIASLREIADRFDHVLLDQWGTLHEGKAVFPEARACVRALRAVGKRVLIPPIPGGDPTTMRSGWLISACPRTSMTES